MAEAQIEPGERAAVRIPVRQTALSRHGLRWGTEERWCSSIIRDCYFAVGVNTVVLVGVWLAVSGMIESVTPIQYWMRFIIAPTLCMLILNMAADASVRSRRVSDKAKIYISLSLVVAFCTFLCLVHSIIAALLLSFVVPVFVSTVFTSRKITRHISVASLFLQLICGVKMAFFSTREYGPYIWVELAVACGVLVVSYYMAQLLIYSGKARIESLAKSDDESRDLKERLQLDQFTELYNKKAMAEHAERFVAECQGSGAPLAFAMFDIDDFKHVNDTLGHAAGDMAIQAVAELLLGISCGEVLVSRIGGDEFGVLFVGNTVHEAYRVCEQISRSAEKIVFAESWSGRLTLSCGIAGLCGAWRTTQEIYGAADAALYRAKSAGKNKIIIDEGDRKKEAS